MDRDQKRENWLKCSPFMYSYLSLHPVPQMHSISSVRWLKGLSRHKSSFKFNENVLCVGGYRTHPDGGRNSKQGVIALYKATIPKAEELDDDRLRPIFQPRSELIFRNSISSFQQISVSPSTVGSLMNKGFAVNFEDSYQIHLVSLHRALQEPSFTSRNMSNEQVGVLTAHQGPITQLKWGMARGKQSLFSSSLDSLIFQWDLEKMTVERQMKFHRGHVVDISIIHEPLKVDKSDLWPQGPETSSNYTLASLGADGDVFLWDCRSKNPVNKISLKESIQITSIACISSEGLITGTSDGKVQFWDLRKKQKYQYEAKCDIKEGHKGRITSLQLNRQLTPIEAKNKYLGKISFTSAATDGKIIQWQDKIQFVHEGHSWLRQKDEKMSCCFDRQEECDIFASACSLESTVMLWQPGVSLTNTEK